MTLIALAAFIFWESYKRLLDPQPVQETVMLVVAVLGLVMNGGIMWGLHTDTKKAEARFNENGDLRKSGGNSRVCQVTPRTFYEPHHRFRGWRALGVGFATIRYSRPSSLPLLRARRNARFLLKEGHPIAIHFAPLC